MIVQAPDGKNIDFGDAAPEQIKMAMGKLYPKPSKDISLGEGVYDMAKTGVKSIAALPVLGYEELRHPIDTMKTMASGATEIPGAWEQRAGEDINAVSEDVKEMRTNPDYWQKFLHGGRAGLTAMASPLDMAVGVPYENTFGRVVDKATNGGISAREAAFLPQALAGARIAPKAAGEAASAVKTGIKDIGAEIKPNLVKTPDAKALDILAKKFAQGEKGGGASLKDAVEMVRQANAKGRPMTLADAENQRVKGLAGSIARIPGVGKDIAQKFIKERDSLAGDRLEKDVNKYFSNNSALKTITAVAEKRSAEGKPLFDKAYQGGSMAPLEKQFEKSFNEAAELTAKTSKEINQQLGLITQLRKKLASSDMYNGSAKAGIHKDLKHAEAYLGKLEGYLHIAHEEKAEALEALRGSQADKTANAPGAVWNPHIARMMKNPEMKRGISKGLRIERNLADAENRPFNAHEYAIVGEKDGEPVVGKVPNMRLLAAAKQGLDALLSEDGMRDPKTGRLTNVGRSVDTLRRSLLKNLYEENPDYKAANDSWSGHSRSIDMVKWGQDLFTRHPDATEEDVKSMTPSEKEFARLGAGDTLREKLFKAGFHGDEAKSLIRNAWMKKQLRPFFDTDDQFRDFVNAVTDERTMFENKYGLTGGSPSAERLSEDASNIDMADKAGKGVDEAFSGKIWGAIKTLRALAKDMRLKQNPELNEAIAKLLFDPKVDLDKIALPSKVKNAPTQRPDQR